MENMADRVYGKHMSFRLRMERGMVSSQLKRIPVLPTSHLALDILAGRDADMDFEDFLGHPSMPAGVAGAPMYNVHDVMESALGM
jgi:hypothetical protein